MIKIDIPGREPLMLEHLVCDVNGTLAVDGQLIDGISQTIMKLGDRLQFHMLTADTHGKQKFIDEQLDIVVPDINTAFELLLKPIRIIASLRK